jgi:hypothetical protein
MSKSVRRFFLKSLAAFLLLVSFRANAQTTNEDVLVFGNSSSEKVHSLTAIDSKAIVGGLKQTARVLLPKKDTSFEGGTLSFIMNVDGDKQNYFTTKFWGSDRDKSMLMFFCEGKQVGYRHLGDIDLLWLGNGEPPFNDRFFYVTLPIPTKYTRGKKQVHLQIRSYGDIWGYGETFAKYQHRMTAPTLGIYSGYTHTATAFTPNKNEVQGKPKENLPVRTTPGPEVMDALKKRVNKELVNILSAKRPLNQLEMMFVAPAYSVKWTAAYNNPQVIDKVVSSIDAYYKLYLNNPDTVLHDKSVYNSEWLVAGPIARAIRQLWKEMNPLIDQTFDNGKGQIVSHRQAWSQLLQSHLKYSTTHRRQYTNQTMIVDLFMYDANWALMLIDPQKALPEKQTLHYLYEAVALTPWLGKETPTGSEKPLGNDYWQLTDKGLTKELGFVGYYGEVLDWIVEIYKTTSKNGEPNSGDEKIKQQLLKVMQARSYFRYPAVDDDGYKAMRAEAVVGWRDNSHYPGDVLYGDRAIAWDATPLMTAAATLDPKAVGIAQQMIDDNQFFNVVDEKLKLGGLRVTKSLLNVPDEYELIMQQKKSSYQLPMSRNMPDFVFSDEEDGVVAIKNGDDILYTSLYWRARNAVNSLAKVHYITPTIDRIANIYIHAIADSSGMTFTRPPRVNMGFSGNREWYKGIESAHTGEVLPIAKIPAGVPFKVGDENVYAGKASYYEMEYGDYLIAMNTTKDKTFELKVSSSFKNAKNLTGKDVIPSSQTIKVLPRTTVVLYKGGNANAYSVKK